MDTTNYLRHSGVFGVNRACYSGWERPPVTWNTSGDLGESPSAVHPNMTRRPYSNIHPSNSPHHASQTSRNDIYRHRQLNFPSSDLISAAHNQTLLNQNAVSRPNPSVILPTALNLHQQMQDERRNHPVSGDKSFCSSATGSRQKESSAYVDLTTESPQGRSSNIANEVFQSNFKSPEHTLHRSKRRRVSPEEEMPPQIDADDFDSDSEIAKVLERQRVATINEQQAQAERATRLSNITCVVCMEELTDMTVTHCGHLFCHTCLMEALIAGENQGAAEPGKGVSKCPICRKRVKRPKDPKETSHVIPLEIKIATRNVDGKGKARA